jgi:3-deoxy-D-manno-octulosonic-acid transferase
VFLVSGIFRRDQPFSNGMAASGKKCCFVSGSSSCQNESSVRLLSSIGINNNVSVTGDTRFDRVIEVAENFTPVKYVDGFCANSKVIVAGSTWEDDEAELTHYVKANPAIRFIIAPHETDEANLQDVKKEFPTSLFYSQLVQQNSDGAVYEADPGINVLIIDNVGMLSRLYHYADITYVGGGFGVEGVHNVLEAAVYGKPVLFGPEFEKYAEATDLVEKGAAIPIANALEVEKVLTELWNNDELLTTKGAAARQYVYENVGASKKNLTIYSGEPPLD